MNGSSDGNKAKAMEGGDLLIEFDRVTLRYPTNRVPILSGFSLGIAHSGGTGRIIVFMGPSGCGKSTFLRALGGLLAPSAGEIRVLGRRVDAPSERHGIVFQNYTCFDWLTVSENVRFPLELKHMPSEEADGLVSQYLEMVGLADYGSYFPRHLSGGMRQRVAIARSLINRPDLLLMDEPFGALDHFTREDMQQHLIALQAGINNDIVFITHDIGEAVYLGDEIFVMSRPPMRIYRKHVIEAPRELRGVEFKYTREFIDTVRQIEGEIKEIMTAPAGTVAEQSHD